MDSPDRDRRRSDTRRLCGSARIAETLGAWKPPGEIAIVSRGERRRFVVIMPVIESRRPSMITGDPARRELLIQVPR